MVLYLLKILLILWDLQIIKIIVIENNGKRDTFLDNLDITVYYTNNNLLPVNNKGYKELRDIHDCIIEHAIHDTDFIVKMTGRYLLNYPNTFMNIVKNNLNYDCIIKYGSFITPANYKMHDCITGLIGMTCKYIKQIQYPNEYEAVEWNWAKITYSIEDSRVFIIENTMDINICPGSNTYFLV